MKITRFAALGLAASLVLAACGSAGNGENNEPPKTGDNTGTQTEQPAERSELTLWLAGGDTPDELRQWLIERMDEDYNTDLKIEEQDWNGLVPKLQTALASADQTPDVVEVGNTQAPLFTHAGAFEDLSDMYEELGGDDLIESFITQGSVDGTVYSVPYYSGARAVFYNKEMFEEAGVEVPETLDELQDVAVKLQEKFPNASGFYFPGQDWYNGIAWIFAHGGEIAVQNGDQWEGQLSSEKSLEGLKAVADLMQNGNKAPADKDSAEPWVPFNVGDSAMFSAPTWARWSINLEECDTGDEWDQECNESKTGIFALPGLEAGTPAPVLAGGSNIGIGAKSENKDRARDLLRLIFSSEYQNMLGQNGLIPGNGQYADSMGDDVYAQTAVLAALNGKLTPAAPRWADVEGERVLEDFFQKLATGADVEKAAADADARLNEILNK